MQTEWSLESFNNNIENNMLSFWHPWNIQGIYVQRADSVAIIWCNMLYKNQRQVQADALSSGCYPIRYPRIVCDTTDQSSGGHFDAYSEGGKSITEKRENFSPRKSIKDTYVFLFTLV